MKKENTAKIKTLDIKNGGLDLFIKLLDVPMHSEKARARNRVMKILMEKEQIYQAERQAIIVKYCKKGPDKKPIVNNNTYSFERDKAGKFSSEVEKLVMEKVLIDVLPSLKADLKLIKDVVASSKLEMNYTETELYEEILAALKVAA